MESMLVLLQEEAVAVNRWPCVLGTAGQEQSFLSFMRAGSEGSSAPAHGSAQGLPALVSCSPSSRHGRHGATAVL